MDNTLSEDQARLLDSADFHEDPRAYVTASAETAGYLGRLTATACMRDAVK